MRDWGDMRAFGGVDCFLGKRRHDGFFAQSLK